MAKRRKRKAAKKIDLDKAVIFGIGGTAAGVGLGHLMTDLAAIKKDSPIADIHHWVVGVIASLTGIILNALGVLKGAGIFLVSLGLGITLTDLPHLGKQLDNLRDQDPLTEGLVSAEQGWVTNSKTKLTETGMIDTGL